jgi:phosphoadenosine phosphosulfate reductase
MAVSTTTPDLEKASAQEVLAYAVEHYHPNLKTACSFQKEESVLAHMLSLVAPDARLFVIDTGVLFAETLATWKRFEDRYPQIRFETVDASNSEGGPWTKLNCCGQAKVDGLDKALSDTQAWVTGIRREQSPTRADAQKLERDEKRGIMKFNPLADWTGKDLWRYIVEHDLPYNPLHDQGYESIGCAPCTLPGSGREGRWAGDDKTECGIHV